MMEEIDRFQVPAVRAEMQPLDPTAASISDRDCDTRKGETVAMNYKPPPLQVKLDKVAVGLLGTWRAISEALKSHVEPQSQTCGLTDSEGAAGSFTDLTAMPWAPLLLQPSKAFAVLPPGDLDVPFDPDPIGLEKEMDMLFFDPGRTGYIRPEDRVA
ncbi:uncharacterized protein [Anas acuta]|uniref:uncharacterized protein isoform X4 n=1 Tax=Anas acuta TaxID=28680 RepID=UPI0035C8FB70